MRGKRYSNEARRKALELLTQDGDIRRVSRKSNITIKTLKRWKEVEEGDQKEKIDSSSKDRAKGEGFFDLSGIASKSLIVEGCRFEELIVEEKDNRKISLKGQFSLQSVIRLVDSLRLG